MRGRFIAALLVAAPIAEIASIVIAADLFGTLVTLALLAGGVVGGILLMRRAGRGALQATMVAPGMRAVDLRVLDGAAMLVVAGLLLAIPGFVSDLAAAVLVIATTLRRRGARAGGGRAGVVELAPEEYRRIDDGRR